MEALQTENQVSEALKENSEFSFAIRSLQLSQHLPVSPFVRKSLIKNTTLRSLKIIFEDQRQDWKFIADIIKNKKLRKLTLRVAQNDRTDPDFKYFCESTKDINIAENLHLFNVLQTEENVEEFCDLLDSNASVERLSIFSLAEDIFSKLAYRFMDNKTVKQLRVWEHKVNARDIANIIKYNDALTSISFNLSNLDSIGESLISALKLNCTLKKISLEGSRNGIISITQGLKRNFSLRKVTFWGLDADDEQLIRDLIEEMKNKIEHLTLVYSKIGENLDLLRELLSVEKFKTLKLVSCNISSDQIKVIGDSLKTNQNLTHLDLSTSYFNAKDMPYLVEGLKANKTLKRLNLTECDMSPDSAEYLAEILKSNSTLQDLNLGNNFFDGNAVKTIGESLKLNKTLLRLSIYHDDLENALPAFIEPLKVNRSLEFLTIKYDSQDNKSIFDFCQVLKDYNSTLTTVILRDMQREHAGVGPDWQALAAFKDIFTSNRALTKFKVQDCMAFHIQERFHHFGEENKRQQIAFMKGMKVLMLNIVKSPEARQMLPIEIWRIILSQLDYPGIKNLGAMAESICK